MEKHAVPLQVKVIAAAGLDDPYTASMQPSALAESQITNECSAVDSVLLIRWNLRPVQSIHRLQRTQWSGT